MKNYSKTPLFGTFRKALRMTLAANKAQTNAEEIIQRTEEATLQENIVGAIFQAL